MFLMILYLLDYQYVMLVVKFSSFPYRQKNAPNVKFLFWAKISFCQIEKSHEGYLEVVCTILMTIIRFNHLGNYEGRSYLALFLLR